MPKHSWLRVFLQAEQEPDDSKLHARIMDAEEAILVRMRELRSSDGADSAALAEYQEIRAALDSLLLIKTERLHWPPLALKDFDGNASLKQSSRNLN